MNSYPDRFEHTIFAKDFNMNKPFVGFFQDFEGRRWRSPMLKKGKYFEKVEKPYKKVYPYRNPWQNEFKIENG